MVLLSVASERGKREYMEDYWAYFETQNYTIAFVCDGHGGRNAAQVTSTQLVYRLAQFIDENLHLTNPTMFAELLRRVITEWGDYIKHYHSGSTLTGVVSTNSIVYVFNIGDSRTLINLHPHAHYRFMPPVFSHEDGIHKPKLQYQPFLFKQSFFQTLDHEPSDANENYRVKLSGGTIRDQRLNGTLAVTRALGDNGVGEGLSHVPDMYWIDKKYLAGPIIMISDGIYEAEKQNKQLRTNHKLYWVGANHGAAALLKYAMDAGSTDNLTCMCISV